MAFYFKGKSLFGAVYDTIGYQMSGIDTKQQLNWSVLCSGTAHSSFLLSSLLAGIFLTERETSCYGPRLDIAVVS